MACCAKCIHALHGIELITQCTHPSNVAWCAVQGHVDYCSSNYYLNRDGNCKNFEEGTPQQDPKWAKHVKEEKQSKKKWWQYAGIS